VTEQGMTPPTAHLLSLRCLVVWLFVLLALDIFFLL